MAPVSFMIRCTGALSGRTSGKRHIAAGLLPDRTVGFGRTETPNYVTIQQLTFQNVAIGNPGCRLTSFEHGSL